MLTNPQLKAARDSLLTTASLSAISADTAAGMWADIARAAETIADTSTTTSETLQGTMQRAAVAIEGVTGTDGAAENPNYEGLLSRIVDALEDGEVGEGSLSNRFVLAAEAFSGGTPTPTPTPGFPSPVQYADALTGWGGLRWLNTTPNPDQMTFKGSPRRSIWCGYVTATEMKMRAYGSTTTDILEVSVDGGAWAFKSSTGDYCTLFTGLALTRHFVRVRWRGISDSRWWLVNLTDAITTDPVGAYVEPVQEWLQPYDGSGKFYATAATIASTANFSPTVMPAGANPSTYGSNPACGIFVTDATKMVAAISPLTTYSKGVFVSVDGGEPTLYERFSETTDASDILAVEFTLPAGTKTVRVWQSDGSQSLLVGRLDGSFTSSAVTTALHQFGGSTTQGDGGTNSDRRPGWADVFMVASGLGRIGTQFGQGGNTNAQILSRATTNILPNLVVGSGDVAIMDGGRNDGGTWSAPALQAYKDLITALLAKGYRGVICRNFWGSGYDNASVAAAVASFADPRVQLCDASGWTGIATSDGIHPTIAGYVTIRNYALAAYPALIAAMP